MSCKEGKASKLKVVLGTLETEDITFLHHFWLQRKTMKSKCNRSFNSKYKNQDETETVIEIIAFIT